MSTNRLSWSAINTYSTCSYKYKLRYVNKLRSKYLHGALAFGSAIDLALNTLLRTKDVEASIAEFDKAWAFTTHNKKYVSVAELEDMVYAKTDLDGELLQPEDISKLEEKMWEYGSVLEKELGWIGLMRSLLEDKEKNGWVNVHPFKKKFYNYANWLSMRRKGIIMIQSYAKKALPQFKEVMAVQKENYLINEEGDKIVQYLDLIVELQDGTKVLLDNKTSAREYRPDAAGKSPQLLSYFTGAKEEYKLDAVGFVVLMKNILKNRVKICSKCAYEGTGARHKTCSNEVDGKRCNGLWDEQLFPEADIKLIVNKVDPLAEELVLDTFQDANKGIKLSHFPRNLSACDNPFPCEFRGVCWKKDNSEIVDVSKEETSE